MSIFSSDSITMVCFASSTDLTTPPTSEITATPFGFFASKISSTRGRPCVISSAEAVPPAWKTFMVSCVPGSPID